MLRWGAIPIAAAPAMGHDGGDAKLMGGTGGSVFRAERSEGAGSSGENDLGRWGPHEVPAAGA